MVYLIFKTMIKSLGYKGNILFSKGAIFFIYDSYGNAQNKVSSYMLALYNSVYANEHYFLTLLMLFFTYKKIISNARRNARGIN
jgi:hypothetical protein